MSVKKVQIKADWGYNPFNGMGMTERFEWCTLWQEVQLITTGRTPSTHEAYEMLIKVKTCPKSSD